MLEGDTEEREREGKMNMKMKREFQSESKKGRETTDEGVCSKKRGSYFILQYCFVFAHGVSVPWKKLI